MPNTLRLYHFTKERYGLEATGAIMSAWKDVDAASVELITLVANMIKIESLPDIDFQNSKSLDHLVRNKVASSAYLRRMGLLPIAEANTMEELRKLRNRAAHEPDNAISVEEARQYVRVADKLTDSIRTKIKQINTVPAPIPAKDEN